MSAKGAAERARATADEPAKPKPPTEAERLKSRVADLLDEVAALKDEQQELMDGLESQEDAKLDEESAQVKFAQLREQIRVLNSQVREWQGKANLLLKENNSLRKVIKRLEAR
jgi:predicted RNase H-like nuclease (RuvC/YqgF family)